MGRLTFWLGALVLLTLAQGVSALSTESLYNAKVEIADRSFATRMRVMDQAMAQVIAKVTGSDIYLENPTIKAALEDTDRYLQAYSYSTLPPETTYLHARFGVSTINQLLRSAGVPIWPANRPEVVVWLAYQDDQQQSRLVQQHDLLDETQPLSGWQQLQEAADAVGLPVVLPGPRADGALPALTARQLWAVDKDALSQSTRNYGADGWLAGRVVSTASGQWQIRWQYAQGSRQQAFDSQHPDLNQAMKDGLAQLTRHLSSIYAVSSNRAGGEALSVTVTGIDSFEDYAKVIRYLDGLAVINRYELTRVQSSQLAMTVYLNGSYGSLTTALSLDNYLVANAMVPGDGISFRWKGY